MDRTRISNACLCGALAAAALSGCSPFAPRSQMLHVDSRPSGAFVIVDGEPIGLTPTDLEVSRPDAHTVVVFKDEYMASATTTKRKLSTVGRLDRGLGFGMWPWLLASLTPGAYQQSQDTLDIELVRWMDGDPPAERSDPESFDHRDSPAPTPSTDDLGGH